MINNVFIPFAESNEVDTDIVTLLLIDPAITSSTVTWSPSTTESVSSRNCILITTNDCNLK